MDIIISYYYKYLQKERIFIRVIFGYGESCRHVYKDFRVFRNGKKSNIKGLQKYLKSDYPKILTAKCFFWTPSQNAYGRRNNEAKRDIEVYDFFMSEGFTEESTFYLDSPIALRRGELFGVDYKGYFLEYRNQIYYFGFRKVVEADFAEAREAIRTQRVNNIEIARKKKESEANRKEQSSVDKTKFNYKILNINEL